MKNPFAVLAEMATKVIWRGLRDYLRNFLLSAPSYSVQIFNVKFEELRRHTSPLGPPILGVFGILWFSISLYLYKNIGYICV
ncbi:MAG: hypothetical protein A2Z20_02495 [Bdellovibrionales bacterium RBG_16_40_8]|nr:MAG: hypothetical protein A2Z20_02495 [Bdellovibrionales bacterium RBG_16_40_8]